MTEKATAFMKYETQLLQVELRRQAGNSAEPPRGKPQMGTTSV